MGKAVYGARPPSQVAYYVALAGILALLCMLLVYFACFCVKKVKELVQQDCSSQTPVPTRPPQPVTAAYPVQPVVRDSASAMAKLCRALPAPAAVHPAARSPAPAPVPSTHPLRPAKAPTAAVPRIEIDTVDAR